MTRILSEVYEFSLEIIKVSLSNQITTWLSVMKTAL